MTMPAISADLTTLSVAPPSAEPAALTHDEIELINAHGPFNHSIWRGRGVAITHEEGLAGRVEFLSSKVREAILKEFTKEQLARMSIVDVGCYDGWLLESLSDLPFARMVGIEPRAENIKRGKQVRDILRIASRVRYQTGTIDTLDENEQFDIVLCMGVLHHLEAIASGLRKLRGICGRQLILETLLLSSRHLTPDLKHDAEMKDVVYRYKPQTFGITLQRFEGAYYPGSGVQLAVINVPTLETLRMHLDVLGFENVNVLADWESYREAMPNNQRPISAACVSALVDRKQANTKESPEAQWVEDYEARMAASVLSADLIVPLHGVVCAGEAPSRLTGAALLAFQAVNGNADARATLQQMLPNATHREIVAAFPYCAIDKVRLECAKRQLMKGNATSAIEELQKITRRTNADWRSCYRAFYLQWRAALHCKDARNMERSKRLCLTCNPNYPMSLFDSPPPFVE